MKMLSFVVLVVPSMVMLTPNRTRAKVGAVLCCLMLLALVVDFFRIVSQGWPIDGDIFSLLPNGAQQVELNSAIRQHQLSVNNKLLFLVGADDVVVAEKAASYFESQLHDALQRAAQIEGVSSIVITGRLESDARVKGGSSMSGHSLFYASRYHLLDTKSRGLLEEKNTQALVQQSMQLLFSPLSVSGSSLLEYDPQLLFLQYLSELSEKHNSFAIKNHWLTKKFGEETYFFVDAGLGENVLSMDQQIVMVGTVRKVIRQVEGRFSGINIVTAGAAYHAAAGVIQGKREVSTVGFGSAVGVLFLLVFVFRSVVPVVFSLVAIGSGSLAALVVCFHVFGSVHVMALVFGASLTGVTIDYAFHFYTEKNYKTDVQMEDHLAADRALRHVFPGIFLGMLTSVVAYLSMGMGSFLLMRQVALFSAVGLFVSFLCVVYLFPVWRGSTGNVAPLAKRYTDLVLRLPTLSWMRYKHAVLPIVALLMLPGVLRLHPQDDVRLLQTSPEHLKHEEQRFFEIMGIKPAFQFYLVGGESAQGVLEREENLISQLELLKTAGSLGGFTGITMTLPSEKRQRKDYQLRYDSFQDDADQWRAYYQLIGFSTSQQEAFHAAFLDSQNKPLTFDEFRKSDLFKRVSTQWVGGVNGHFYSIVTLTNVMDVARLKLLAEKTDDVAFIDQAGDFSRLLKSYRESTSLWLLLAYGLIALFLVFRYGFMSALRYMVPPVFAAWVSLAVIGYSGQVFNIFNIFALILVLGIGIDYVLFFAEGGGTAANAAQTMLSITLSAITTILSFGLLALSETHAISGFGFTMLTGISVVYFLSPVYATKSLGES